MTTTPIYYLLDNNGKYLEDSTQPLDGQRWTFDRPPQPMWQPQYVGGVEYSNGQVTRGVWIDVLKSEDHSELVMAGLAKAEFKALRAAAVASIVVTSSLGRAFQGDEESTTRMLKPIEVLKIKPAGATTLWVLADNTPAQVGLAEFLEVLELAGAEQTRLWLP